jgi:small conductance mechanosensitive channel
MLQGFLALLLSLGLGLIVFFLFLLAGRAIQGVVRRVTEQRRRHRSLGIVLGRLAQWGVVLFGLLVAVTVVFPGFTPANLISALGITGIAIGFAFKDIFQNFLAGILILLTEPFRIDDQIVFGSYEGTVEQIQARATTIRTYDGRRVVIPNAELFTNSVTVNTAFDARRLEYDVGIGYGDDAKRACDLMLEAVRSVDGVLADPAPDVLVYDLAASTVNVRVRWWIRPPRRADALDTQDRVLRAVKRTLAENGIDLPFPTQQILFHDQTEETDGNRREQREGWPAGRGEVPAARMIPGRTSQEP